MARTKLDLDLQSDLPLSEANLQRLGDNSLINDLHRHSELCPPGDSPDPALHIDNDGKIILSAGTGVNEFSIETGLGASDDKVPTQNAVKSYVDNGLSGKSDTSHTHGQLHTQNTDTGTSQTSFQIDSGNSGHRIKHSSGALICRNAADDGNADFQALNIAATAGLYVGGVASGDQVITSGRILQNINQATIDNIRINGANIGHTSDTDLLALAVNKLTINGALETTKGLKLPLRTTLAVNSDYAVGECWFYYHSSSGRYYLLYKDEDGSVKGAHLDFDGNLI